MQLADKTNITGELSIWPKRRNGTNNHLDKHENVHALLDALAGRRRLRGIACQKANFIFIYLVGSKESARAR